MADQNLSPKALPYGPATNEVRRFLQRLAALEPAVEAIIVNRYDAVSLTPAYQAAERVLGGAIGRSGREQERDALAGPLLQLVQARSTPSDGTPLRPIAEPALAALLAILMQDVLTEDRVIELYAPFENTIPRNSLQH